MTAKVKFSLRWLFVGLTLFAVLLAVSSTQVRRQREAVRQLRQQPEIVDVWYEHEVMRDDAGVVVARISPHYVDSDVPPWLLERLGVDWFYKVIGVLVMEPSSEDTLAWLKQLPYLQEVHCVGCDDDELTRLRLALPHVEVFE